MEVEYESQPTTQQRYVARPASPPSTPGFGMAALPSCGDAAAPRAGQGLEPLTLLGGRTVSRSTGGLLVELQQYVENAERNRQPLGHDAPRDLEMPFAHIDKRMREAGVLCSPPVPRAKRGTLNTRNLLDISSSPCPSGRGWGEPGAAAEPGPWATAAAGLSAPPSLLRHNSLVGTPDSSWDVHELRHHGSRSPSSDSDSASSSAMDEDEAEDDEDAVISDGGGYSPFPQPARPDASSQQYAERRAAAPAAPAVRTVRHAAPLPAAAPAATERELPTDHYVTHGGGNVGWYSPREREALVRQFVERRALRQAGLLSIPKHIGRSKVARRRPRGPNGQFL